MRNSCTYKVCINCTFVCFYDRCINKQLIVSIKLFNDSAAVRAEPRTFSYFKRSKLVCN